MSLKIGQLAKQADIGIETIRFYEREGLLPAPPRSASGYRHYAPGAVSRLQFIRRAKHLGFTLAEIGELLQLQDGSGSRADVKALTKRKLEKVEQRIADLRRMRKELSELSGRCNGKGPVGGCPIIEALTTQGERPLSD